MNKQYEMSLNVFEKQNSGTRLDKREKNWKKRYNKARTENVKEVDGVKITRFKPNWENNKNL